MTTPLTRQPADSPNRVGTPKRALGRLLERGLNAWTLRVPGEHHDLGSMPTEAVREWLRRRFSPGPIFPAKGCPSRT
jgi:hypothetical protein